MDGEVWKAVSGYVGLYEVSNFGRVKSLPKKFRRKSIILKTWVTDDGYVQVHLYKDGFRKAHSVHVIVAYEFIRKPLENEEVNHKNEVKTDNWSDNLEWVSASSNCLQRSDVKYRDKSASIKVVDPDGMEYLINNLGRFCKEQGLHRGTMWLVAAGKQSQYKGWKCQRLEN